LLCFHKKKKKNATDAHRIICEIYSENVIAIRTCANWFWWIKTGDFDISDKEHFESPAAMEENELRENEKKSWKMMENTSINLYLSIFLL